MLSAKGVQVLRREAGELLLHIFVQLVLRVFGGLIHVPALRHQLGLRCHDRSKQVVELLVVEFPGLDLAALDGPEHIVGFRFRLVQFLQL